MRIRTCVLCPGLCAALAPALPALAGDGDGELPACFRYADAQPPSVVMEPAAPAPARPFGAAETRWWTVGAGIAHDFNGSTDTDLNVAYTYFLAEGVEFGAEVAGWHFNQAGENTLGGSATMLLRWHFLISGPWTVYTDVGIGLLVAEDVVPEGGTSLDLMPRAGVGFTRALGDGGVRLQMGLRWHHISNARIHGEANNPARDQPMLYAGIMFPF